MDFVETIANLDQSQELHTARLLLLIHIFGEGSQGSPIEGLTKLAKLDFLLRYPVMLERALKTKNKSTREVHLENHERSSVESQMVRYRFGPWDHRYREFLNILVAKDLVSINLEGRKVVIGVTDKGRDNAVLLSQHDLFVQYVRRARLLKRHFDLTAMHLVHFIYDTFPEIVSLRPNEAILS